MTRALAVPLTLCVCLMAACSSDDDGSDAPVMEEPITSVEASSAMSGEGSPAGQTNMPALVTSASGVLTLQSPVLQNHSDCSEANPEACDTFPDQNTSLPGQGNLSPELSWTSVPPGTQSFAITLQDLTYGQPHWAIWNIPGDLTTLPAGVPGDTATPEVPAAVHQTNATFAEGSGYFGPQAPCNVYQFELYALSVAEFSPTQVDYVVLVRDQLEELGDAILGRATLTARTYSAMMCD